MSPRPRRLPIASVGTLHETALRSDVDFESPAADLIADSMLAATRAREKGGAQIALVNATGVRVNLPGGPVRYRDAFSMMPFGNNLLVLTLSGAELKMVLEQQYAIPLRPNATLPAALAPSMGFTYTVDLTRPEGDRVSRMQIGRQIDRSGARLPHHGQQLCRKWRGWIDRLYQGP